MSKKDYLQNSKVIIIVSELDIAGLNMQNRLQSQLSFNEIQDFIPPNSWPKGNYRLFQSALCSLLQIPNYQIHTDYLKDTIKADLLIYASKHSSAMGKKALLVHTTGIWGKESGHGGNDHEIAFAPAFALTYGFNKIKELKLKRNLNEFWIGAEVTHHGPSSLKIPIMYIETGGTEEEWSDVNACNLIADVIIEIVQIYNQPKNEIQKMETKPAMIGIGGGHYAPSFIKKLENQEYMLGHIIPKYAQEEITEDLIKQSWDKTISSDKIFVIDKKGIKSKFRHRTIEIIENLGYPWIYT